MLLWKYSPRTHLNILLIAVCPLRSAVHGPLSAVRLPLSALFRLLMPSHALSCFLPSHILHPSSPKGRRFRSFILCAAAYRLPPSAPLSRFSRTFAGFVFQIPAAHCLQLSSFILHPSSFMLVPCLSLAYASISTRAHNYRAIDHLLANFFRTCLSLSRQAHNYRYFGKPCRRFLPFLLTLPEGVVRPAPDRPPPTEAKPWRPFLLLLASHFQLFASAFCLLGKL